MMSRCLCVAFVYMAACVWVGCGGVLRPAVTWPDLTSQAPAVGGGERDAAVVIGIGEYFQVPDISGADTNAVAWVEYLHMTRGVPLGSISLLRNQDATKAEIYESLSRAAERVGEGGTIWFVFVGHGIASKDGKEGLLVGADAKQSAVSLYDRSVSQGEVIRRLKASKAGHVVAVMDTCFSGLIAKNTSLTPGLQPLVPLQEQVVQPDVTIFTAGSGDQFAGPLPRVQRPAFSYLLLGALRGWGDEDQNGEVTALEAHVYAYGTLSFVLGGTRRQTPQLLTDTPERVLTRVSGVEMGPDVLSLVTQPRARLAKTQAREQESSWAVGATREAARVPERVYEVRAESRHREEKNRLVVGPSTVSQDIRYRGMVQILAGTFTARRDSFLHTVPRYIQDLEEHVNTYWIDRFEVTVDAYAECVVARVCSTPKETKRDSDFYNWGSAGRGEHPINGVTLEQARAYCAWRGGRLPTHNEWEKAARGPVFQKYPWGNAKPSCKVAVIHDGEMGCGEVRTWPVGSKPWGKSPYGVYDMIGNVEEWTGGTMESNSWRGEPSPDNPWYTTEEEMNEFYGPDLCVTCGGGWSSEVDVDPTMCSGVEESYVSYDLGFRCVKSP